MMIASARLPLLIAVIGCLALHAAQAAAGPGDAPPLPTGKDTGESFGAHHLSIDGFFDCPGFENSGLSYEVEYRSGKRYRSSIGGATNLKGKIKVKKNPILDLGEQVFLATFKLNAKGERKIQKWVTGLVRQCTGDPKAKLKIKKLRYETKTREIGGEVGWQRIPTLSIEGKVKSQGQKLSLFLDS